MKYLFLTFCVCLVLFLSTSFLAQAQQNPSADQVLDSYVKALGGKEALQKINSRISKGSYKISSTGINADLEMYAKAPNSIMLKINISKTESIQRVFNGTQGWAKDISLDEVRPITGSELSLLETKADFYWPTKIKTLYPKLSFKEKDIIEISLPNKTIDKKEVYVLESEEEKKPTETFYFDTKSGLLVLYEIDTEILVAEKKEKTINGNTFTDFEAAKEIVPIKIYYENYKEIDGIKIPMITRQAISSNNIIIELTSVEHNKPIDDKLFAKPAK